MKKFLVLLLSLSAFSAFGYADQAKSDGAFTVTGEVLDMSCYLAHGAHGAGHAACGAKCIRSGQPVGIKSASDDQVYLLIGQNKPINDKLADNAAKTITVTGKLVQRSGIKAIENVQIKS